MIKISSYSVKLLIAGDIIELTKYQKPVHENLQSKLSKTGGRNQVASKENREVNREIVLRRARKNLRNLINANVGQSEHSDKFLTLTYAENMTDLRQGNKDVREFIRRLGWHVAKDQYYLKYITVPEFQKRGAVHYHILLFNMPYVSKEDIGALWRQGYVKINRISKVDNLGAYVSKYMTKDRSDERLRGNKSYFSSKGLYMPYVIKFSEGSKNEKEWLRLLNDATQYQEKYTYEFETEHYGTVNYTQYRLINQPKVHTVKSSVKGQV